MSSSSLSAAGARVSARGWGWRHAGRRAWALSELELEIEPGERVLLLGASGSGKSTLLHGLAGVLGGDEEGEHGGSLLIDGIAAERMRGAAGLVLQDPDSQLIMARLGDDVAFGCENLGVPREQIWPRVAAALDAVGLALPLDHPTSALSGGQKQRLALAGLVAMRPRLLLLDEPTANLDPQGVAEVRDAVGRVLDETGATLVVVEHRVEVWLPLVTRVIVLGSDGQVMADGPPDAVLTGQARRLSEAGVWVPGRAPRAPRRGTSPGGGALLTAQALAVARVRGTRRRPASVIRDGIDLTLGAGEALAVTGPNGSGKSTLALTLAGLLPVAAGSLGASPELAAGAGAEPFAWKSRQLLSRIGSVFQDPEHQFLAATVRKELAVGLHMLGNSQHDTDSRVDELLQRLHLEKLAEAHPFTLSGGEKRRLSVATALATRPRILMLDEPTFGQDARTWQELVALLAELLDEGSALVAATHDADFVRALATRELSFEAVTT